jgi:hypothetical protein
VTLSNLIGDGNIAPVPQPSLPFSESVVAGIDY